MYEEKTKEIVIKILNDFFIVEQGNRITINNMTTLVNVIGKAFDDNKCPQPIST